MEVKNVTQKFDAGDIYCLLLQLGHSFLPFRLSTMTSFQLHLKLQFWQGGIKCILPSADFWLIGELNGIGQCDNK